MTRDARVAAAGSVMLSEPPSSVAAGSKAGALIVRRFSSASCWIITIWLSSCSFSDAANRSPAVTKSVVRSIAREPMIVIVSLPVAALVSVTEPVPFELIVTV